MSLLAMELEKDRTFWRRLLSVRANSGKSFKFSTRLDNHVSQFESVPEKLDGRGIGFCIIMAVWRCG
jgi:hypothetical protein